MLCNYTFHHIKISSNGLMIKHEQFDLNHSTKHIFTQKYILCTLFSGIVKPSLTIPGKSPIIGSLCEPGFHGHLRPHSNQYMIYFTNYSINQPNSLCPMMGGTNGFQKFLIIWCQVLGPIKRPFKALNQPKH